MTEETIHIDEEDMNEESGNKRWSEEIPVDANQLVGKVQELMREAAVRKITIKDESGKQLLSFPLYAGVVGVFVLGPWSALGLVAAWFAKFSILIEREASDEPASKEEATTAEAAAEA